MFKKLSYMMPVTIDDVAIYAVFLFELCVVYSVAFRGGT